MNIVWFSWKDRSHPLAGGAEKVSGEIMDRLVANGHKVRHITALYPQSTPYEHIEPGLEVYRTGNRYTVYPAARRLFKNTSAAWADVVIDEMNTLPFLTGFYAKKSTNILLAYQLAREVWFYQMPLPLSLIGYLSEPIMLNLLARGQYSLIATESDSSKSDMEHFGLKNIRTFRVGIETPPLPSLPNKQQPTTILSLGAIRPMKRTLEAVKAFEVARDTNPDLRLTLAGDTSSLYAQKVTRYINNSRHKVAIEIKGRVSNDERLQLMQEAGVILVTSIKEGWGLIVTEANSQGTPAIVYDVDGLRDSVEAANTGVIVPNGDYVKMGEAINHLIGDSALYETYRGNAWRKSQDYTFDNSYNDFMTIIEEAKKRNEAK